MSTAVAQFEERFSGLLEHVGAMDVAALLEVLQTRTLAPGEAVITRGTPHDSLLLVEWGELVVTVRGLEISRLGPGEVAGEVGLLSPGVATASVRADEETMLHVLSGAGLATLWAEHPAVASALVQGLTRVISERLRSIEGDVDQLADQGHHGVVGLLRRLFGRAA